MKTHSSSMYTLQQVRFHRTRGRERERGNDITYLSEMGELLLRNLFVWAEQSNQKVVTLTKRSKSVNKTERLLIQTILGLEIRLSGLTATLALEHSGAL